MKLLRIKVEGLSLFKDDIDVSFYGKQRVSEDSKKHMYPLTSKIFLNNTHAFIGKNASGKTSILHVIVLALNILNNEPINHIQSKIILRNNQHVTFYIYYYSNGNVGCLKTVIASQLNNNEDYYITEEKLWLKSIEIIKTKKDLTNFDNIQPIKVRRVDEAYLSDDVSMIIAENKKNKERLTISNLMSYTNTNTIPLNREIPLEIISYLDSSIESLYIDEKSLIHLKFKGKNEILINHAIELENYLSSGTMKGITTFINAKDVLDNGGYLLVDELENHFNKEIVSSLIYFFMDPRVNVKGGTLIYTTHYPELLDIYERNDNIFIMENRGGIVVKNLSELLNRNDIKKSESYQSGMIGDTVPNYRIYIKLKRYLQAKED